MWRTVANWVLGSVLLGWLCAFLILRDPEVKLRRRLKDQVVESLLEVHESGWRFQRLKRERDFLLARASQGRTNIAALSTVALASRQVLRDAQHAPSSWSYFARVGVAPLTGDVNEPTLHALISLWRDFRRLPTLDLDHLERELDCRYPLRDEPLFVFGSNCSQEQRTDILARRLLRRTRLCMRREVQLRSAPTARNEATRSQPDSNHVDTYIDRIVQTFQDLAVAPFPNRCWFEDFVPRVYEWYDAEGACGQRVEALHDAIAAAILLHYELERRSVELRHAYCAFWRQRRVDSRPVDLGYPRSATSLVLPFSRLFPSPFFSLPAHHALLRRLALLGALRPYLRPPTYYALWTFYYLSFLLSPILITILQMLTLLLPLIERGVEAYRRRLEVSEWGREEWAFPGGRGGGGEQSEWVKKVKGYMDVRPAMEDAWAKVVEKLRGLSASMGWDTNVEAGGAGSVVVAAQHVTSPSIAPRPPSIRSFAQPFPPAPASVAPSSHSTIRSNPFSRPPAVVNGGSVAPAASVHSGRASLARAASIAGSQVGSAHDGGSVRSRTNPFSAHGGSQVSYRPSQHGSLHSWHSSIHGVQEEYDEHFEGEMDRGSVWSGKEWKKE
uniref:FGENESH: predicted gene_5.572 protein n=1 Tax=Rhodotorula toruloides TaxID=5286 RepID=A0A0K3CIZ6_RHOTO